MVCVKNSAPSITVYHLFTRFPVVFHKARSWALHCLFSTLHVSVHKLFSTPSPVRGWHSSTFYFPTSHLLSAKCLKLLSLKYLHGYLVVFYIKKLAKLNISYWRALNSYIQYLILSCTSCVYTSALNSSRYFRSHLWFCVVHIWLNIRYVKVLLCLIPEFKTNSIYCAFMHECQIKYADQ